MDNDLLEISSDEQGDIKRGGMTITQFLSAHGIEETPKDLSESDNKVKADSTASSILVDKDGQKYNVGKIVAKGGMGAILSAKDLNISRIVAMKVMLDPDQASKDSILRFIEEAKVTGQLEHPSIVPIHELSVGEDGNVFYTMKFVKGMNLDDILKQISEGNRKIIQEYPLSRLLNIFLKTCDAMSFSHHKGVIHRDLKPENIMVGDYGEVLVMDWGLSKIIGKNTSSAKNSKNDKIPDEIVSSLRDEDAGSAMMTMEGTIMGTPAFMPPEQAKGELDHLDARSDIYSLGGILYNILTLHPPVEANNINQLLLKVVKGEILSPTSYNNVSGSIKKSDSDQKQLSKEEKRKQALSKAIGKHQALKELGSLPHCPGSRIPTALASVAMKALSLKQEERYQSVENLQKDIEAYQGGFATSAQEAGLLTQMILLVKRHKSVFGTVFAALMIFVLLVSMAFIKVNKEKKAAVDARMLAQENEKKAEENEKKATEALNDFKKLATKATPEFIARTKTLLNTGKFDKALQSIDAALALDNKNPTCHILKAIILLCKYSYTKASVSAKQVLSLRPNNKTAKAVLFLCSKARKELKLEDGKTTSIIQIDIGDFLTKINQLGAADCVLKGSDKRYILERRKMIRIYLAKLRKALPDLAIKGSESVKQVTIDDIHFEVNLKGRKQLKSIEFLKGMPLTRLNLDNTQVKDISALKGMPLTMLCLSNTQVKDISALKGMPLAALFLENTQIKDISVLKGMPLTELFLHKTQIEDISALKGMRLTNLTLSNTPVNDISVLKGMPLKNLSLWNNPIKDISALKGMSLTHLTLQNTPIKDISVLKGMPLTSLWLQSTRVKDISALKGMPLTRLSLSSTPVNNISVLKEMPLKMLDLYGCKKLNDLTPLAECKQLEKLAIPNHCKNIEFLRKSPNLKMLGNETHLHYLKQTTTDFWKRWEKAKKTE